VPEIGMPNAEGTTYTVNGIPVSGAQWQSYQPVPPPSPGPGGPANGIASALPEIGGNMESMVAGATTPAPGTVINLTVGNSGIVVGANGLQQFSTMVSNQIAQQLGNIGVKLNRQ
jgi:hypothetical protein